MYVKCHAQSRLMCEVKYETVRYFDRNFRHFTKLGGSTWYGKLESRVFTAGRNADVRVFTIANPSVVCRLSSLCNVGAAYSGV